jgi:hypothetical protein
VPHEAALGLVPKRSIHAARDRVALAGRELAAGRQDHKPRADLGRAHGSRTPRSSVVEAERTARRLSRRGRHDEAA